MCIMQTEVKIKQKLYVINEEELQRYLEKEKIDYTKEEIISLINSIINIYILKYPIDGYKNNDLNFHLGAFEQKLTENQKRILTCPYSTGNQKFILRLHVNDIYQINMSPIYIEIDPNTAIVDDFSIMCLTKYYRNLSNNITIEELFTIIKEQNHRNIDYHEVEQYLQNRKNNLELRSIILSYIKEALKYSDYLSSNGEYRSQMFEKEFTEYYNLELSGKDEKLIRTKKTKKKK